LPAPQQRQHRSPEAADASVYRTPQALYQELCSGIPAAFLDGAFRTFFQGIVEIAAIFSVTAATYPTALQVMLVGLTQLPGRCTYSKCVSPGLNR
jgi:hypothetical protein